MIMKRIYLTIAALIYIMEFLYSQDPKIKEVNISPVTCDTKMGNITFVFENTVELLYDTFYLFKKDQISFVPIDTSIIYNDTVSFNVVTSGIYRVKGQTFMPPISQTDYLRDKTNRVDFVLDSEIKINLMLKSVPKQEYCDGETINLQVKNPNSNVMYYWDNDRIKPDSMYSKKLINISSANIQDSIWLYAKSSSCFDSLRFIYFIKPSPKNDLMVDKDTICDGENVQFSTNSIDQSKYSIYFNMTFGISDITSSSGTNSKQFKLNSLNDINLNFKYHFDLNGCKSVEKSGVIHVIAKPKIKPIMDLSVCSGIPLNIELGTEGLRPSTMNYIYNGNTEISQNTNNSTNINIKDILTSNSEKVAQYQITAYFNSRCKSYDTLNVTVKPLPAKPIPIDSNVFICKGSLWKEIGVLYNPNYDMQWSNDSLNFIDSVFKFTPNGSAIDDKNLYYRSVAKDCYSSIGKIEVDVLELPNVKIIDSVQIIGAGSVVNCKKSFFARDITLGETMDTLGKTNISMLNWTNSISIAMANTNLYDPEIQNFKGDVVVNLRITDSNGCSNVTSWKETYADKCELLNPGFKSVVKTRTSCQGVDLVLNDLPKICATFAPEKFEWNFKAKNLSTSIEIIDNIKANNFDAKADFYNRVKDKPGKYIFYFTFKATTDSSTCYISDSITDIKIYDLPHFLINDTTYCEGVINPEFKIIYNPVLLEDNKYTLEYAHSDGTRITNCISSNDLKLDSLFVKDINVKQSYNLLSVVDMFGCKSNNIDPFSLNRRSPQIPSLTSNLPICQGDSLRLKDTNLAVNQIAGWNNKQKAFKIVDPMTISIGTSTDSFGCVASDLTYPVSKKDIIQSHAEIIGKDNVCQKSQFNQYCPAKLEKDISVQYQWIFNNVNKKTDSCYSVSLTSAEIDSFVLDLVMTTNDTFGDNQCKISARKTVIIDTTQSRASSDIRLWPGNLLVCSDSESSCYQWIRTDSTGVEENILNCNGKQACAFQELDFNKYNYSVRTSGYPDCSCAGISTYRSSVPKKDVVTEFKLYPNPTSLNTVIHLISAMEDHGLVEIYNVMGQLILQADHKIEVLKNEIQIPSEQFQSGVYFVKLKLMNQETETIFKLVKE